MSASEYHCTIGAGDENRYWGEVGDTFLGKNNSKILAALIKKLTFNKK